MAQNMRDALKGSLRAVGYGVKASPTIGTQSATCNSDPTFNPQLTTRTLDPDLNQQLATRNSQSATFNPQPSTRNPQLATPIQPSTRNSQSATLNSQPVTRNSQPATRNSQPATFNPQLTTRTLDPAFNQQPSTRNSQPVTRNSQSATLNSQPVTLNSQFATFNSQPVTLNSQPVTRNSHLASLSPQPAVCNPNKISSLCHLLKKIGIQEDIIEHISDVLSHEIPRSEEYTSSHLEGLARDILQQLVKTSGPVGDRERGGWGEGGMEREGDFPLSPSSFAYQSHCPLYVALVGPTGTGKTTTIAKLAAEILLKKKKKVGLITIDSYRVGAIEQLNTYAGIMNIPIQQASTFEQMRKAVLQYLDQDVVLIDTAGFSHHDREHLQLLNAFLAQVSNPEVHLVLNTNTDEKELIHISQKFNMLHYDKLLFTKLDESSYPGTIFNHMIYTGKPISYITTGQKVPEDIEVATQAGIINLMFQKKQFYASPTLRAEL
jgi:flagellar biosynthesis GTPase FlhF